MNSLTKIQVKVAVFGLLTFFTAGVLPFVYAQSVPDEPEILGLSVNPNGNTFAGSDARGMVRVFALSDGTEQLAIDAHNGVPATCVTYSSDGAEIISGGRDTAVREWLAASGELNQVFTGHEFPVKTVDQSPNGQFIASGGEETGISLWDVNAGQLNRLAGHTGIVNAVKFSNDGRRLVSAGTDSSVIVWDTETGNRLRTMNDHAAPVNTVLFSPDDQFVISAGDDSQIILWDAESGERIHTFNGHQGPVSSMAFHPDGKTMVSGGAGSRLLVWDTETRRLVGQVSSNVGDVNAVAVANSGTLIAGGKSGRIALLDINQGTALNIIEPAPPGSAQTNANSTENTSDNLTETIVSRSVLQISEPAPAPIATRIQPALPGGGPGGPILLVTSNCSSCGIFNDFYAEILLNEGFNEFAVADISTLTATSLNDYDVVLLASMPLTDTQVSMFTNWVTAGGNLIAMRPDTQLAGLFGLDPAGTALSEGYIMVDVSQSPGNGIANRPMQIHGAADQYNSTGASVLATLYSDNSTETANPALTINNVGSGQAAAFTFDLATSVVLTRQGNPAWEAEDRDDFAPTRPNDMFFGNAENDPQPDWVDLANIDIPQADEQQRLLANLIVQMNLGKKPLPRFWYFPRGKKAVLIMTGADHNNNGTSGRFDQFIAMSPENCSVDDWECVRATSYIFPDTPITDIEAANYLAQGFEIAVHIDTSCNDYTLNTLDALYTNQVSRFRTNFPGIAAPITQQHHCFVWSDWSSGAEVQSNHGIRLDTSYLFWSPGWVNDRPGFFNGTAMPMRFTALNGSMIDVYQATAQMTDEADQSYPSTVDTLLDRALGAEGFYGVFTMSTHSDVVNNPQATLAVQSAQTRGVPVVSSIQMLNWLDGRNESSFSGIAWNGNILNFSVAAGNGANGLQAMLPAASGADDLVEISSGGASVSFNVETIKGIRYATFPVVSGEYTATYGVVSTPLSVVSTLPSDGAVDIDPAGSIEVTFSEAVDPASVNVSNFTLTDSNGNSVAASVTYNAAVNKAVFTPIGPLATSTSYSATVKGGAGGVTSADGDVLPADVNWSFFTSAGPACPCGVWDESTVPTTPVFSDPASIELGVKFVADIDGFVAGIRFYQANPGSYVANLWTTGGQLLATQAYTAVSPGWQQVDFAAPIAITANTVYVASYFAPAGNYAGDNDYFVNSGVSNGPIRLLQDGENGGNGVYAYGLASTFPNNSYRGSNYWVDVAFEYDRTPPQVTAQIPAPNAINVAQDAIVTASFNEAMNATTINSLTFELRDPANSLVPSAVNYNDLTQTASLTPISDLASGTTYSVRIAGGLSNPNVKDLAGNALAADALWAFTTVDLPPVVSLTAPSDGEVVSGTVSITATASDDVGVSGVQFIVNGAPVGSEDIVEPYSFAWNTAVETDGDYTISAVARDGANNTTTSPVISVTVSNLPQNVEGLVAYFNFEEGSGPSVADGSGNNNTGTITGATWMPDGPFGSALSFDGVDDWVTVADSPSLDLTDAMTLEAWVNPAALDGWRTVILKEIPSELSYALYASDDASRSSAYVRSGTTSHGAPGVNPLPLGAWSHLAATFDGTTLRLYENGIEVASKAVTGGIVTSNEVLRIGGNSVWGEYFNGLIDEVRIYNRVLTPAEIQADMALSGPVVTSVSPANNATGVNAATQVTAVFSEALDAASVNTGTFEIKDESDAPVAGTIAVSGNTITFTPTLELAENSLYTATLKGGVGNISDLAGDPLVADFTWSFATGGNLCTPTSNPVVCENSLLGSPPSEWEVNGAGDSSIQGFSTDISVNVGDTVRFKIDTPATDYRLDIYRMGYYAGSGARKIATVEPSAALPQAQPGCLSDATGLLDCGNWSESASWQVPADAVSGIYFAKAIREDGPNAGLASHIMFVVRNDASTSEVLFQTADTTWQAYNNYGGNNTYSGNGPGSGLSGGGRAYKVSYNRPFVTRSVDNGQDWVFNAEYPMVRWLEANGYDVSYFTDVDSDRRGSLINNHKLFLSVGHDEYWSAGQRSNVEAARDAGVHLAFFSGNEVFWKIRWENSIDGSGAAHRTMVCYKETHEGAKIDPLNGVWTGTWRDPRFSPPADGGRPENALTGTLFTVNAGATTSIRVPEANGKLRFWRNTSVANLTAGNEATLPFGTLGYEWDEDVDNGFRPAGLIQLSLTTVNGAPVLTDFGSVFGSGTATHALTLYRAGSGALVFGAGTVQWSWGLDSNHDRGGAAASPDMQQATVNLFADMSVQPASLQPGLVAATASTDNLAPTSTITQPAAGSNLAAGTAVTISGTASDIGGLVGGVEVSVDGGATWHPAVGRGTWTYQWTTPSSPASATILTRATDDSANLETPGPGITVNVL